MEGIWRIRTTSRAYGRRKGGAAFSTSLAMSSRSASGHRKARLTCLVAARAVDFQEQEEDCLVEVEPELVILQTLNFVTFLNLSLQQELLLIQHH